MAIYAGSFAPGLHALRWTTIQADGSVCCHLPENDCRRLANSSGKVSGRDPALLMRTPGRKLNISGYAACKAGAGVCVTVKLRRDAPVPFAVL
ncbi:MAG: hypothetical protein ACLS7Z_06745 [Christensenellales bacterium]